MLKDLVNSLARLERIGNEESQMIEKLHAAARRVAAHILIACPVDTPLPRGYRKIEVAEGTSRSRAFRLFKTATHANACTYNIPSGQMFGWVIDGDGTEAYPLVNTLGARTTQQREGSLAFANDIATGLLTELANFLEQMTEEEESLTHALTLADDMLTEHGGAPFFHTPTEK